MRVYDERQDKESRVRQEAATLLKRLERQGDKEYVILVAAELHRRALLR